MGAGPTVNVTLRRDVRIIGVLFASTTSIIGSGIILLIALCFAELAPTELSAPVVRAWHAAFAVRWAISLPESLSLTKTTA